MARGARCSGLLGHPVADQVMAYLTSARWFAGKGRLVTLRSLTPLPWLNETAEFFAESAPAVRLEIAEVAYAVEQDPDDRPAADDPAWAGGPRQAVTPEANGPREFYQLALSYRPAPHPDLHFAEVARFEHPELGSVVAYDAARDPEACRVLLRALVGEARLGDRDTTTRFHRTERPGLTADLAPRVFTGQQSNTSVVLGDVAMLKLFRRLELGRNLDIEVHDALNRAGVRRRGRALRLGRGQLDQRRRHLRRRPGHGGRAAPRGDRRLGPGPGPARGRSGASPPRPRRSAGRWPRPTPPCGTPSRSPRCRAAPSPR